MCMADTLAMADEGSGTERVRDVCAVLCFLCVVWVLLFVAFRVLWRWDCSFRFI